MPEADAERRGVPTRHQLKALRRVLAALGAGAEKSAMEASYPRMPTGGLLSSQDLLDAERTLVLARLVVEDDDRLIPCEKAVALAGLPDDGFAELMVLALLEAAPPLWLGPASGTGEVRSEFIPDGESDRLAGLGLSPEERDALLLAAGRKYQPSDGHLVGATGELEVMHAYQAALTDRGALLTELVHVSLISDQLGYDVKAPDGIGGTHRLEVKTCSTRGAEFTIFLSRNEAATGARDPSWRIVVCRQVDGSAEVVGWIPFDAVAPRLPEDPPGGGQWESTRLSLQLGELAPGLPLLSGCHGA